MGFVISSQLILSLLFNWISFIIEICLCTHLMTSNEIESDVLLINVKRKFHLIIFLFSYAIFVYYWLMIKLERQEKTRQKSLLNIFIFFCVFDKSICGIGLGIYFKNTHQILWRASESNRWIKYIYGCWWLSKWNTRFILFINIFTINWKNYEKNLK